MTGDVRCIAAILLICLAPLAVLADEAGEIEKIEEMPAAERIEAYQALIERYPDSGEVFLKLGNAYYDLGEGDKAVEQYHSAWKKSGSTRALVNLTFVLIELERTDEAGRMFKDAIKKRPKDPIVRAYYGDFLADGENEDQAIRGAIDEYRYALYLDEQCVEAHFGLGVLFARTGIYKEAIREWEKVIEIDSTHFLADLASENIQKAKFEARH